MNTARKTLKEIGVIIFWVRPCPGCGYAKNVFERRGKCFGGGEGKMKSLEIFQMF